MKTLAPLLLLTLLLSAAPASAEDTAYEVKTSGYGTLRLVTWNIIIATGIKSYDIAIPEVITVNTPIHYTIVKDGENVFGQFKIDQIRVRPDGTCVIDEDRYSTGGSRISVPGCRKLN